LSRIRFAALLTWLALVSPAAVAMSVAPADPELAPETVRIPLTVALGGGPDASRARSLVYEYVVAEPVARLRITPRTGELLRTSYEREQRGDVATVSRAVLVELDPPASP
jgi:hypothetical protein